MAENAEHQGLLEVAKAARADRAVADQLQGALETLHEKVPDDPIVATNLPKCVAFCRLLRQLLQRLSPLVDAMERRDPIPGDFDPARAKPLIEEWRTSRVVFLEEYRKSKDYLEELALRIYR